MVGSHLVHHPGGVDHRPFKHSVSHDKSVDFVFGRRLEPGLEILVENIFFNHLECSLGSTHGDLRASGIYLYKPLTLTDSGFSLKGHFWAGKRALADKKMFCGD
jgi:hypothetical protein